MSKYGFYYTAKIRLPLKRRFWMKIHDWAEKLWHYAYYKAYPKANVPPGSDYQYAYSYVFRNSKGEIVNGALDPTINLAPPADMRFTNVETPKDPEGSAS